MSVYLVCSGCDRYVKREDCVCPFCGIVIATIGRDETRPPAAWARMSRAQWLAYASTLTMVGCFGGRMVGAAGDDGGSAGAVASATILLCGPDQEAGLSCDPKTQYCFDDTYDYMGEYSCVPKDAGPLAATGGGDHCPCQADDSGLGCLFSRDLKFDGSGPALCSGNFHCDEDDRGAVTVSCHSCYGSPPARLERLARRRIGRLGVRVGWTRWPVTPIARSLPCGGPPRGQRPCPRPPRSTGSRLRWSLRSSGPSFASPRRALERRGVGSSGSG